VRRQCLTHTAAKALRNGISSNSVVVTERYIHLRPNLFAQRDLDTIPMDLGAGSEAPVQIGHTLGSDDPEKVCS